MPQFKEGDTVELLRWEERPPKTFSLKNYPWICDLLGTKEIIFPKGRNPKGRRARDLRTNLAQYWVEGGLVFISRIRSLKKGKRLRERIDWKENEFQLKLRKLGEILEIPHDDLRKTRQALLVGELMEEKESGKKGVLIFKKQELLQLAVGVHAYRFAQRKYIGKKH